MLPEIALIIAVVYAIFQIRKFYNSTTKFPWTYLIYYLVLYVNAAYSTEYQSAFDGFPIRAENGEMEYVSNKKFTDGTTSLTIQSNLGDTKPVSSKTVVLPTSTPSEPSDPVALLALS